MIKTLPCMAVILSSLVGCSFGRVAFHDPAESACVYHPRSAIRVYEQTIAELTYDAVDELTSYLPPNVASGVPIIVSSVTDAQYIEQTSEFGNIIADFARSRLAQDGMIVSEPRLRSAMLLKTDQGEIMLGREPVALVPPPTYSAILAGTYAVGDTSVYVSLKLIRADNAQILAAADFVARRSQDTNNLLGLSAVAWGR